MKKFLQKPFKYSLTKNILLIIGILVVGYVIINLFLRIITRHNQELTVPDMTGMNLAEASAVAAEADLRLEVTDSVYIRGMERGAIARQNPEPGGKVKKNRRILLVINSVIPRQSTMPSLTGFSLRQARTELASNGLNIGKLIYVNDMATDNVLAQQYMGEDIEPGTRLNSGTAIDLVLGLNPADSATFIPYIIGYRYQMAGSLCLRPVSPGFRFHKRTQRHFRNPVPVQRRLTHPRTRGGNRQHRCPALTGSQYPFPTLSRRRYPRKMRTIPTRRTTRVSSSTIMSRQTAARACSA